MGVPKNLGKFGRPFWWIGHSISANTFLYTDFLLCTRNSNYSQHSNNDRSFSFANLPPPYLCGGVGCPLKHFCEKQRYFLLFLQGHAGMPNADAPTKNSKIPKILNTIFCSSAQTKRNFGCRRRYKMANKNRYAVRWPTLL